jgi:nicotinamidase/pyrazinamidase
VKTVFFDVDTQLDFLYPAGALAVPGAPKVIPALSRLTRFAADHRIQIISTADAHSEDDPEFKLWKPHCVVGTAGQQRAAATSLSQAAVLPSTPGAQASNAAQIIVEKQNVDCFTNPNLRPLLDRLGAGRYVVYGVVSEVCVGYAAFGLLETGARVEVVTDAIKSIDAGKERETIERFESLGGLLTTVDNVLATALVP